MKIEFLLVPEYGEQSERKNEQSPFSSRCCLAAVQRDSNIIYTGSSLLYSGIRLVISPAVMPSVAAGGTLPSGHTGRYSSCHSSPKAYLNENWLT